MFNKLDYTLFNGTSSAGFVGFGTSVGLRVRHIFVLIPQTSRRQITPITNPITATIIVPAKIIVIFLIKN